MLLWINHLDTPTSHPHAHAGMTWLLHKALKGRPDVMAAVKHSATLPIKTPKTTQPPINPSPEGATQHQGSGEAQRNPAYNKMMQP